MPRKEIRKINTNKHKILQKKIKNTDPEYRLDLNYNNNSADVIKQPILMNRITKMLEKYDKMNVINYSLDNEIIEKKKIMVDKIWRSGGNSCIDKE